MKKAILFLLATFCFFSSHCESRNDSILKALDKTIRERSIYTERKETRIQNYKELCRSLSDKEQIYSVLGKLFDEYRYFNTDSAFHYATLKLELAGKLHNLEHLSDARMNIADIMSLTGMYKEALDMMASVHSTQLPEYLRPYYYHLYRNMYGLMADYAIREKEKIQYNKIVDTYRDSLLIIKPKGTIEHTLIDVEKLLTWKRYDEALSILNEAKNKIAPADHNLAFLSFSLAQVYKGKGDREKMMWNLAVSSISDLQSAVKEYVSLRELAYALYESGDIDRAYTYLKCSMEDARSCNARQRTIEIGAIFPIIDKAYTQKNEKQKHEIVLGLLGISVLSVILLITIFFLYKQMRKVAMARRHISEVNIELSKLNKELKDVNNRLQDSNNQLKETNLTLSETNFIKEEYIGRYMDQCSTYLEKMDTYRRSLGKIASTGKVDELYKSIKSTQVIENELKEFYLNFDATFLRLFPNFVADFNHLLLEGERIYPKANEQLNTELRIYALIRLGITDSVKIAQFLRYSVTTIYNYRTKVRNKAAGERDEFEDKVMQIGRLAE